MAAKPAAYDNHEINKASYENNVCMRAAECFCYSATAMI